MLRKIIPLVVLAAMAGGAWVVFKNPPEVNRSPRKPTPAMSVQVQTITPEDYPLKVQRFGRVVAQQRTPLIAEAAGEVLYLAPELRAGGTFSKGQLLITLDDSRYVAELAIAKASLTESEENYAEQQALAEQARQAWALSGQNGEPSARVLRKPQLKAAAAQVESARSSVKLAELSLSKARIKAPFDGSVAALNVEEGQAISSGAEIATLIANRAPEIEVALHQRDLEYLMLDSSGKRPDAETDVQVFDREKSYFGTLIRTAAELDAASQQLMARVQLKESSSVSNQDKAGDSMVWPRVGSLVETVIKGQTLKNVIVIPNSSVYQSGYVYLVIDGKLQKQNVVLGWQDDHFSVVESGLKTGDQLVVTPLGQVTSGTLVTLTSAEQGEPES